MPNQILKYTLLPGILPRAYDFFASGFKHIPFLMATIYQACGLLPATHPYLNPRNIGHYGIRHVIAQAAERIVFSRKNIDQIVIFTVLMIGIVFLIAQFILLLATIFLNNPVLAAPVTTLNVQNLFWSNSAFVGDSRQDLALILLDKIFGTPGIFNSCVSLGINCITHRGESIPSPGPFPTPFHTSLHALLQFYSLGIFVVSMIVIIYFIITITAETAVTGTPFGQRISKPWAMIRLFVFFALLVPMNVGTSAPRQGVGTVGNAEIGLNMAQIITLWTAKVGSNFASNGWGYFNGILTGTLLGQPQDLVALPSYNSIDSTVRFMFLAKTCQIAESYKHGYLPTGIRAYLVRDKASPLMTGSNRLDFETTDFATALRFNNMGSIAIVFGAITPPAKSSNPNEFRSYTGEVKPVCGQLTMTIGNIDDLSAGLVTGAQRIQEYYYEMVQEMWLSTTPISQEMKDAAQCVFEKINTTNPRPNCTPVLNNLLINNQVSHYNLELHSLLDQFSDAQVINSNFNRDPSYLNKGWAGAAIWYNRLASLNGNLATSLLSPPKVTLYPSVMERVAQANRENNENVSGSEIFSTKLKTGRDLNLLSIDDREIASVLNIAHTAWDSADDARESQLKSTNNAFIDTINSIFGIRGIYQIRCNTDTHPLAQLTMLGKGMMYAALGNYAGGAGLLLISGPIGKLFKDVGADIITKFAGDALKKISVGVMAMSFLLAYVLPFMPFIYFTFAVMGWLKAIFEAIVAMPLWALSHITRIDGQGLPGPAATNGYFLLLEILLRPILILFGLLASIQIFSALVYGMNQVFDLVTANVGGFDFQTEATSTCANGVYAPPMGQNARGAVDRFFYTFVYVVLCYMLATGTFKLIDTIPNSILRWAGVTVSPLNSSPEEAGAVLSQSYRVATIVTQDLKGGNLAVALK